MVAMSSGPLNTAALLRKASRIAGRLSSDWYCVYVRTPEEHSSRVATDVQRRLVGNIQLAQGMGADVVTVDGEDVAESLVVFALEHAVGLVVVGQPHRSLWRRLRHPSVVERLVRNPHGLDVMVVPFGNIEGTP